MLQSLLLMHRVSKKPDPSDFLA